MILQLWKPLPIERQEGPGQTGFPFNNKLDGCSKVVLPERRYLKIDGNQSTKRTPPLINSPFYLHLKTSRSVALFVTRAENSFSMGKHFLLQLWEILTRSLICDGWQHFKFFAREGYGFIVMGFVHPKRGPFINFQNQLINICKCDVVTAIFAPYNLPSSFQKQWI